MANATLTPPQSPVKPQSTPRQSPRSQVATPTNGANQESSVEDQNPSVVQEESSVDQDVQDPGGRSTGSWILWFIFAGVLDLIGIIPVLGEITSPIAIWFFRFKFRGIKSGKQGVGFSKGNMFMTIAAIILSVTEIVPVISSVLPGCLAIVTVAYLQEKIAKKIKESLVRIAPAARGVEKAAHYAKYIPGLQEAAVVEAGAAGVARTGEGVAQGESVGQAATAGTIEGAQKGVGSFTPAGGATGQAAGAGVGAQYGAGALRPGPVQAGATREKSIFEKVKERSEQEGSPYADGEPLATEGLYADVPDDTSSQREDKPKNIKPRNIGGQI